MPLNTSIWQFVTMENKGFGIGVSLQKFENVQPSGAGGLISTMDAPSSGKSLLVALFHSGSASWWLDIMNLVFRICSVTYRYCSLPFSFKKQGSVWLGLESQVLYTASALSPSFLLQMTPTPDWIKSLKDRQYQSPSFIKTANIC